MDNLHTENPVLDLGVITGPLLVFGGPYSNLQATRALLDLARQRSIPPERMICTGDVVAYCADPVATIAAIRASGAHVVMGNCEESIGYQQEDCGCGFEEGTDCDMLSQQWFAYANGQLNEDDRLWLRTRPRLVRAQIADRRLCFIHGSATDISGWVFKSTSIQKKASDLDLLGCDGIVAGHCGLPFTQILPDGRLWMNAGVIGMPANDGTSRGWFSILTPEKDSIQISIESFTYDAQSASHAMRSRKLANAYADALETGYWPNMDVLPPEEQGLQGIEIKETNSIWKKEAQHAA